MNPMAHRDENFNERWGHSPGIKAQEKAKPKEISLGTTCRACGAWRGQLGLEPDPDLYIKHLQEIFGEVKRVLKKTGTLWVVIGDTYNNPSGHHSEKSKGKQVANCPDITSPKLPPKCLCMMPERLAWSLISDGWTLRNKIIWDKPNYMPSSATDRFTNKYEIIYFFTKAKTYFYDMEAVREPYTKPLDRWGGDDLVAKGSSTWSKGTGQPLYRDRSLRPNPAGKQPTDIWSIPTRACAIAGVHYATFPEQLCMKAIASGCPPEVCTFCGKPRTRIVQKLVDMGKKSKDVRGDVIGVSQTSSLYYKEKQIYINSLGWTSCKCGSYGKHGYEGGILLDPFCGIGTACLVAKNMGRRYIGIDIKEEYIEAAQEQMGRWLF